MPDPTDTEAHEALTTFLLGLHMPRRTDAEAVATAALAVLTAHGWGRLPDAKTVEEWGVQYENLSRVRRAVDEESARFTADYPSHPTGLNPKPVRRTVTTYARHVGPWEVVADGEGGRGVGS